MQYNSFILRPAMSKESTERIHLRLGFVIRASPAQALVNSGLSDTLLRTFRDNVCYYNRSS